MSGNPVSPIKTPQERHRITIEGAVQGVGFRPFVYRLARELGLTGWVLNNSAGVLLEAEGDPGTLERFQDRLRREHPPLARILSMNSESKPPQGDTDFAVRESDGARAKTAVVLPDVATCSECLDDVLDPANRRYRYPFTNCTNCGPRYSIIQGLPYDRPNTTMKRFAMCEACRGEYTDPGDRRFHAQPNACPACGPRLALWNDAGEVLESGDPALIRTAQALAEGMIVAVKGLGGFHLMVDAGNEAAVQRLRERKHRWEKPLAVMFPDLASLLAACRVGAGEKELLLSPAAPIVLLARRPETGGIAASVTPGNPLLGAFLPYTPLHHLLLREHNAPLVATSGNLSDEPICYEETEARLRLRGIADAFLVHDRPIERPVDDSVTRVVAGRPLLLRRARGYAPFPVGNVPSLPPTLAVGAHQKSTVAITASGHTVLSQHLGDLDTLEADRNFRTVIDNLKSLYEIEPEQIVCDLHPDYRSTTYAESSGLGLRRVQHHEAHVHACLADNRLEPPVLGVAWDGTGWGRDETVWGGEFFLAEATGLRRFAHFRTFLLPGGDKAVREPRRTALALLREARGPSGPAGGDLPPWRSFSPHEQRLLQEMLTRELGAPRTSSVGRLFDGVAALIGLRQVAGFEGQAAMELEFQVEPGVEEAYPFQWTAASEQSRPATVDWVPALEAILEDLDHETPFSLIAARFHNMLAETVVAAARHSGMARVLLTGGCFQNATLTERTVERLRSEGFEPFWHLDVPPNDGGIALGQLAAVAAWAREDAR